ncbi:MAG: hypothetical protein ACRC7D_10630 [Aeromonas popoffii]
MRVTLSPQDAGFNPLLSIDQVRVLQLHLNQIVGPGQGADVQYLGGGNRGAEGPNRAFKIAHDLAHVRHVESSLRTHLRVFSFSDTGIVISKDLAC